MVSPSRTSARRRFATRMFTPRRGTLILLVGVACCVATGAPAMAENKTQSFHAAKLQSLREAAAQYCKPDPNAPDGWSLAKLDVDRLVSLFKPLRLKQSVQLCAYQFREGGNGNGVVWALPADAEVPPPERCPKGRFVPELEMRVPRPPRAYASIMAHFEGDGSPWSYVAASLLRRELSEYGALWHGCKWSTHRILDEDPLRHLDREAPPSADPMMTPRGSRDEWRWVQTKPDDWKPSVRISRDVVTVTFHTYSGWERQRVFRHTDRFTAGSYDFEHETIEIAVGPGGYLF